MEHLTPVKILLVEDDPADQKLVKISLNEQKVANDLYIASNANEALGYLRKCSANGNHSTRPDLILLDLNLPGMSGKEFLKEIKSDEELRSIPVVILTTSNSENDILESYNLQASGYVNKPVDIADFQDVIKQIENYWFVVCKRPISDR
ncbi:MAG: response regulator [Chloroflexota bacterium]|nr:response regulator [Chloroflexota bacterium]